jgi:hypothetical protein
MAFRIKNPDVASETVSVRVVRVGQFDRWLIVKTNTSPEESAMDKLTADARAFLESSGEFAGVEIQSKAAVG